MLKVLIIEDDMIAGKALSSMVSDTGLPVEIAGIAGSVKRGIELIQSTFPDVLLLDIRLKGGSGFDILQAVDTSKLSIIFTTAYSEYAINAIKFSAIDYLLKPIDPEELEKALHKSMNKQQNDSTEKLALLQELLDQIDPTSKSSKEPNKVMLSDASGFSLVDVKDIIWCEGDKNYTTFHLTDEKKITTSQSLITYEELFADSSLFRVHKSHIVNLNHVKKYMKGRGGTLVLSNGKAVSVSRQKKEDLIGKLRISMGGRSDLDH